jgi:hypothetical protein
VGRWSRMSSVGFVVELMSMLHMCAVDRAMIAHTGG